MLSSARSMASSPGRKRRRQSAQTSRGTRSLCARWQAQVARSSAILSFLAFSNSAWRANNQGKKSGRLSISGAFWPFWPFRSRPMKALKRKNPKARIDSSPRRLARVVSIFNGQNGQNGQNWRKAAEIFGSDTPSGFDFWPMASPRPDCWPSP
jgi:hypothetical protein